MYDLESCQGCFLGLSLGDAVCAGYEGGIAERLLWKLIGKTRDGKIRWTDDTQMAIDLSKSLLANYGLNQDHLAAEFANSYKWSRGYGPSAAKLLKKIRKGAKWYDVNCSMFPQGSFGNGAAMRAPIIAMFFHGNKSSLIQAVHDCSIITHAHPLAIEGAQIIAAATSNAFLTNDPLILIEQTKETCLSKKFTERFCIACKLIKYGEKKPPYFIAKNLGNGIAALESCVTALYIASRFLNKPFSKLTTFVKKCRGDTDTIAAMAGAIWGACNGINAFCKDDFKMLEDEAKIRHLSLKIYEKSPNKTPKRST